MATSEIEKLERRYADNPHGLTFAPLAEVHRKNGDVARALELLTAGLELHPNYIPASIVLGRCHQDLGDLPSAEAAFGHVLRLDDENVIALKCLADINERQERFGEAETWLRRLVSVDRSNDEAKEQLRRIAVARQGEKGSDAETAVSAPVLEMIDLTPEPVAESPAPTSSPPELLPVDIAAMELNHAEQAEPTPPPAGVAAMTQGEEPGDTAEPNGEVAAVAQAETPVEASPPLKVEEPVGQEETVQPLPGLISAEFQPPLEATGGLGVETSEEVVLEVSGESEFRVPDASEDIRSLSARLNPPAPAAPAERELELAVARQPAKRPSYVAAETKGQSVAAFFRALVAARPTSEPGSPGGAVPVPAGGSAPERPAQDVASSSSARGGENPPGPHAVPSGERRADAAVSFDDFFNSEADGSSPLRHQNSDPGNDDLDEFQSWLQKLKR